MQHNKYWRTQDSWSQSKRAEEQCRQWRLHLMKKEANQIKSVEENLITNIQECFCEPLMKVAYKCLSRDKATFDELTFWEQKLWNSFETDQVYHSLTLCPSSGSTGSLYLT